MLATMTAESASYYMTRITAVELSYEQTAQRCPPGAAPEQVQLVTIGRGRNGCTRGFHATEAIP